MEESKYLNEPDTLKFLNCKETTLRNLVKKKLLSKYSIGVKYFYLKTELELLIDSNKVQQRSLEAVKEYEDYPEYPPHERRFIIFKARELLKIYESFDLQFMPEKEITVLRSAINKNGNFKWIGEDLNMTRERIRQIFDSAMKRFRRKCSQLQWDYRNNHLNVIEENKKVKLENAELREYIKNLPQEKKQAMYEMVDNSRLLATKLNDLDITVRLQNILHAVDIKTLGELVSYSKSDILKFRNLGKKTLTEIEELVRSKGLYFGVNYVVKPEIAPVIAELTA